MTGIARNGTKCGAATRQFTFSAYAPLCTPRFTGDNGGATAHGVDAQSITLVARNTSDYDATAPAIGASSFAASLHDLRILVDYFNSQYELYGRKVVVKSFNGKGSFLAEVSGQGQAGASADAQSEYDLGAFADVIPPAPSVYSDALAARKIITFGLATALNDAATSYPYKYQSVGAVPDLLARGVADMVCQRMAGLPAKFAGNAGLAGKKRTFALVTSAVYSGGQGPNALIGRLKDVCGVSVEHFTYSGDPARGSAEAAQIASKCKAAGITTVLLGTDVIFAPTVTTAARQQQYDPEWVYFGANFPPRRMDPTELKHVIFAFPWHPLRTGTSNNDSYRIFKLAAPGGEPQANLTTLDLIVKSVLEFYNGLQAAGPLLTPGTFGRGWFSQPPSHGAGPFGVWSYGKDNFSPDSTFNLQWWNESEANPYDGMQGAPVACKENPDIPIRNSDLGSGQLHCFGT